MIKRFDIFMNEYLNWDWVEEEEEQKYWINDFIINKKWIKVYKKDWDCFINELYENGIIYWANKDNIRNFDFDDIIKGEDDNFETNDNSYILIKIYENEYETYNFIKDGMITYYIDYLEFDKNYNIDNHLIFKC
jgi:hypothetical protein